MPRLPIFAGNLTDEIAELLKASAAIEVRPVKPASSKNTFIRELFRNTVPKEQKLKFIVNKVWKKLC